MSGGEPARTAYVLWHFPKLSETFVVDELLALAELGLEPDIIARERYPEPVTNPRAAPLLPRAMWLRERPRRAQVGAVARVVARHPVRALRCLAIATTTVSRWTLLNLWFGFVLADVARRNGYRYLHAHFADDAAELAYFASAMTGIPYGITAHGVDIYVNRFLCRKLRAASVLVTVCRYNVEQLVHRCPAVAARSIVLKPAGIDPRQFLAPSAGAATSSLEPPTIVAVGRLVPKKGFDTLVRAVHLLRARGVDVRCRLVGAGPEDVALRALASSLGVGDVLSFDGPQPPARVAALLRDAHVLAAPCTVAPNGDRDSMPVVLKEAMAMGVPVVASDDFGIPELVTSDAGRLVPRDDPGALAEALEEVLTADASARAAMGRAGRAIVLERFDERLLAPTLASAVRALLRADGG